MLEEVSTDTKFHSQGLVHPVACLSDTYQRCCAIGTHPHADINKMIDRGSRKIDSKISERVKILHEKDNEHISLPSD